MPNNAPPPDDPSDLRARAQSALTGRSAPPAPSANTKSAHRVLFDLASSADTAADALALLHELQVHQIELDLQADDLRRASAELESLLARQMQLYDFAPVALLTIDREARLQEINHAGAQYLGLAREALLGKSLDSFLAPPGIKALAALLSSVRAGQDMAISQLTLAAGPAPQRTVQASARLDPAGDGILLALTELRSDR